MFELKDLYNNEYAYWIHRNSKLEFWNGTDGEQDYIRNCKKLPGNWPWRNVEISYNYNSLGYRTHEYNNVKENYALMVGSSHSEGIGIHQHQRCSDLIEKKIGIPLLNLSVGGSGTEHILEIIRRIDPNHKPKFIIAEWCLGYRLTLVNETNTGTFAVSCDDNIIWNSILKTNEEIFAIWQRRDFMCAEKITQLLDVPMINIIWGDGIQLLDKNLVNMLQNKVYFSSTVKQILPQDNARDTCHSGPNTNYNWAEFLLDKLYIQGIIQ